MATYSGRCKHAGIDGQVLYSDAQVVTMVSSKVVSGNQDVFVKHVESCDLIYQLRQLYR